MNTISSHHGFTSFQHGCGQTFATTLDLYKHARYIGSAPIPGDTTHEAATYVCRTCGESFSLHIPRRPESC